MQLARCVRMLAALLMLGVAGFVVSLLFLVSIPLMAAPALYTMISYSIDSTPINSSQDALLVSLFGCLLFLVCVHAANGMGAISRRLAVAMLDMAWRWMRLVDGMAGFMTRRQRPQVG